MALMDELEGLLGAEASAKLTPEMRSKLEFGERLTSYYDGDTDEAPVRQPARAVTPVAQVVPPVAPAGVGAGLDEIGRLLDSRLGNLDERIANVVKEQIKPAGDDLYGRTVADTLRMTDELNEVRERHRDDFGERLDTAKFNEFVNSAGKGKFASVSAAYDAFTSDRRVQKKIDDGVREGLKARTSGQNLPGSTPAATKGPVHILQQRRANDGGAGGDTAVSRAAAALQDRMAASQNA